MYSRQKVANALNIFKWKRGGDSTLTTGLLDVPPEIELSNYQRCPSSGSESPSGLLNGEGLKVEPIADLDLFFERLYSYYCEKGLWCIIVKWGLELLSLGFVICFSGFFLLFVDWNGLRNAKCGINAVESGAKPCDLAKEALHPHPFTPLTTSKFIIIGYLGLFFVYWIFSFLRFFVQLKDLLEIRNFYYESLHITDREIQTMPWASVLEKVVQVQRSQQLCVVKDLSAHDVVMRIMRKENYLIGMLNKGVLAFPISHWVPGTGPPVSTGSDGSRNRLMLNKTLQWTLNWCILQSMFDRNFFIKGSFVSNSASLKMRLIAVGIAMLLLSPFIGIFMVVFLFLRHAEQFYNHPSTASSRRWSNLSKWMFREFNEVDHLFMHRISSSIPHASDYLKQFPSPIITSIAKFISFVSGGFAAVLLIIAFLEESLLEGQIYGRNLLWYAAVFGTVTAISRAVVSDELQVLDPEGAMSLVVQHTHYMPKRWRCQENNDAVREEFETLFQYTGMMLLEEMASIFLTPYLLMLVVPKRVDAILQFISDFTVDVEGVGHVCSLSVFDFVRHGNSKYGSPHNASRIQRSSQGKMEKSFLSFHTSYPSWEPNSQGKEFLSNLRNFREQKLQVGTVQAHSQPMSCQLATNFRDQGYVPRDLLYDNVRRTGYQLGSMWVTDPDQKNHPYLLDWYYTCWSPSAVNNASTGVSIPPAEVRVPITDFQINTSLKGEFFGDWSNPFDGRQRSPFEASSSTPNFRDSLIQHHDGEDHGFPTESHWWVRTGPTTAAPQASFLEPPTFGRPNDVGPSSAAPQASFLEPPTFRRPNDVGPSSAAPQASFLEPPTYGRQTDSGPHASVSHRSFSNSPSYCRKIDEAPQASFLEPPTYVRQTDSGPHAAALDRSFSDPPSYDQKTDVGPSSAVPQATFLEPPSYQWQINAGARSEGPDASFLDPNRGNQTDVGPSSPAPQASFLEPPIYRQQTNMVFYDNSDGSSEEQEQCLDWRNPHSLSKTFYVGDSEVDGEFNLPFNDIYQNRPLKLSVEDQDSTKRE